MKSRSPLTMMEALVMLAAFALAAALCLQAFVKSDQMSRRNEDRDRAAFLCQSVAETVKHNGGDIQAAVAGLGGEARQSGDFLLTQPIPYTEDWTVCPRGADGDFAVTDAAYYLYLQETASDVADLGKARVWVTQGPEDTIFELEFAWQEVTAHGS